MAMWGLQWRSNSKVSGEARYLICHDGLPVLFRTRSEAREFADMAFGYIKYRQDLRREPHGWRMPRPVRVYVSIDDQTTRDERELVEERV